MIEYVRKSDDEIEQLAQDLILGLVWGTWNHSEAIRSFLPVAEMSPCQLRELHLAGIVHVYEYVDRATQVMAEDRPMFITMQVLDEADTERVVVAVANWRRPKLRLVNT